MPVCTRGHPQERRRKLLMHLTDSAYRLISRLIMPSNVTDEEAERLMIEKLQTVYGSIHFDPLKAHHSIDLHAAEIQVIPVVSAVATVAQQPRNKGKGKSTKGVGYYKGGSKGQGQAKGKSYSKGSKGGKGYKRPYDSTFDSYPRKGKYP
ncbi:hypothetical protein FOZ60_013591 [Perkinsus olseni]|uniref:Uncharacterized protein n=1 Tax=Perkinsus olseni TaxID=32597 RepID=A0A7J6N9F1_PEROL|nr:hypothetical protein FOZ60_013591 [Perkinsus olseni]